MKNKLLLQNSVDGTIDPLKNSAASAKDKRTVLFRSLTAIVFLLFAGAAFSQIGYTAARSTGITFSSITSTGTSFGGWRNGVNTDDNLSTSTPIGFSFYYDGANRTTFSVSTNGFLTFNTGTTATGTGIGAYGYQNTAFSVSSGSVLSLAPVYDDFVTVGNPGTAAGLTSAMKYKLTGSAPNRVLTVEWIGMEVYGNGGPNLNFQVKLYETTNVIEFWYGTMTASSATYSYTAGLNSGTISATPLNSELYTQLTANTATFSNAVSNSLSTVPAANSKLTFTPIAICTGTPVAGTATAAATSFCVSGSTTLTLSGYTSGVTGITLQWQSSVDGGTTWNAISGATSAAYASGTITSTTKFRCVVKCTATGLSANSTEATVTINPIPVVTLATGGSAVVCSPATSITLNASSSAPSATYQWLLNDAVITGATASTYSATAAGVYSVVLTSAGCSATSSGSVITFSTPPTVTAAVSPTAVCQGNPLNLSAIAAVTDTNYAVSAIAYSKVVASGTSTVLSNTGVNNSSSNFTGNLDDGYWSGIALPFAFKYYGVNYSSLAIATNGNVQFGASPTATWLVTAAPAAGVPDNYIAAPWVDMDHSSTATVSKIEYFTNGTAPNRQFVINWYAPLFGSIDNDTCQLVLYEGSNNIVVNLAAFVNTTHLKTLGIENAAGTVATVVPGKNAGYWQTLTNTSWLFKRSVPVYSWSGPSFSSVLQNPLITSAAVANAGTYTVTVTDNKGCAASSSVTAVVNPIPTVVLPSTVTACAGSTVASGNFTSNVGTATYTWTNSNTAIGLAAGGSGNVPAFTAINTGSAAITSTIMVTPSANGCSGVPASYTITVNPSPVVTVPAAIIVCKGATVDASNFTSNVGTATYTWTNSNTAIGLAASGSGNVPAFTAINTGSAAITSTITVTPSANGCSGSPLNYTITVNPLPLVGISASAPAVCAGSPVTLSGTGAATYTWTSGISNGLAFIPSATATYTVTGTSSAGCSNTATISINVNSLPVITCPGNITVNAASGSCNALVSYTATATGIPAPVISYSVNPGSLFNAGTTMVTATATNSCGTSSCTFNVTVIGGSVNYWVGGTSSDWFNGANWCAGVPDGSMDVQIPSGALHMPAIDSSVAACKNITINAGASLAMRRACYLFVNGNWTNSGTFTADSGSVEFAGNVLQTITGASTFHELELNNMAGLNLNASSAITVNKVLSLSNGIITTNANTVTIANGASVFRGNGYVNGFLKKYVAGGTNTAVTFETGSSTAYTPVRFGFNSVTTGGWMTVNTISADHPAISTSGLDGAKTVNRYWNVVNSGVVFDRYDLLMNYAATDKDPGFVQAYGGVKIYTAAGIWNTVQQGSNSAGYITATGATMMGAVQIGIFNPVPVAISLTPNVGYIGQTANLVFSGRGFIAGATGVNAIAGAIINSTTVNNDSTLTVNISIGATAVSGNRKFAITNAAPVGGISDSLLFTIASRATASFYSNSPTITCNVSGNVEFTNYSSNATAYYWDFGAGASPATATGSGPYVVTYATTGLKTVKLIAFSPAGNDTLTRANYITVTASVPAAAVSISGPASVCSYGTSNVAYTTPMVTGVTAYNWTVPAGVTIVSGQGTKNLIVSFGSVFTSGSISVTETNGCGTSTARTMAVTEAPLTPASLTGTTQVCGLSTVTYTVAACTGATSYTWTLPTGVTSPAGASPVITTGTTLTVNFASTFSSGSISVKANNSCASSVARTLAITKLPAAPGIINGPTGICSLTTATYSIAAVTGASSYNWVAPAGVSIISGQGTTSITVSVAANVASGTLSVTSVNACASSAARTLALSGCRMYSLSGTADTLTEKMISANVYPNPTAGNFNIEYTAVVTSQLVIEVYDMPGKIVISKTEPVTEGQNTFNYSLEDAKKGIYIIRIRDEQNRIVETKRLIVQ